jgi:cell division protein FtsB
LQIVFGAMLAISLLLAINFSGRIAAGRQIESQRDTMMESISTLQAQATALSSELNYVSSDDFVNQWARGEGKMVKPDEVLIVPVPGALTPEPTATPFAAVAQTDQSDQPENWKLWWQLFFDSPPPGDTSSGN